MSNTRIELDLFTQQIKQTATGAPVTTGTALMIDEARAFAPSVPTVSIGDLCLVDDYQGVHIDDALEVKSVDRHGNPTFLMPKPLNFFFTPPKGTWRVTLKKS